MLLVAMIAIIVVGPRDLPKVMRTVGTWARKARDLAREFQSGIDQMAREAEIDELRDTARQVKSLTPKGMAEKFLDPAGEVDAVAKTVSEPLAADPPPPAKDSGSGKDGS